MKNSYLHRNLEHTHTHSSRIHKSPLANIDTQYTAGFFFLFPVVGLLWNSFHSNVGCTEFKPTVHQFSSSAAATQRASALCGFCTSLCQPVCCCLGAVWSSGDVGSQTSGRPAPPPRGEPRRHFRNYLHVKCFTWGGRVDV